VTAKEQDLEITERLGFGILLTLVGGAMDVYSYILRGNVFATGQTGNFVLMVVRGAEKDYLGMTHAMVPIVSFWIGIFIAWHIFYFYCKEKQLLWKRWVLIIEIITLFIVGLVPCSYPPIIANTLLSFAASLQYCAFRKFGTDDNYASIFCTGNMRFCAENYYRAIVKKDKKGLKRAIGYTYILLAFLVGILLGALAVTNLKEKAIWVVDAVLIAALIISFIYSEDKKEDISVSKEKL